MTIPETEIELRITGLIRDSLGVNVPSPSTDLIEAGLLDSLAVVTLITEIEIAIGHQLPLDALDLDSFRSVERICELLAATVAPGGTWT